MILTGLLVSSCSSIGKPEPDISYDGTTYVKIVATNVVDSINVKANFVSFVPMKGCIKKEVSISRDDKYFINYQITRPELVEFIINNKESFKTYLIPNDTITLILKQDSNVSNQIFTNYSIENDIFKYCKAKFNNLGYYKFTDDAPFARKYLYKMGRSQNDYNTAMKALDSEEKKSINFLEKYVNLPKWFVTVERANIQYNAAYARLMMFNDLSSYKQTVKPPISAPFYNSSARLSTEYYNYLSNYFLTGYPSKFNFTGIKRLVRIFDMEYPRIDSLLKGDIKNHFIIGLITSYYVICADENEEGQVDSLFISHDFKLTPAEKKFIAQEKSNNRNIRLTGASLKYGESSPNFELKDVRGSLYKLSDFKGKRIYLHFWATWCGPCLSEIPTLNKLIANLDTNKVVVVSVCLDNEIDKWKQIINVKKLSGINLICDGNWDQIITSQFLIAKIPHYTLIDENNLILKNNCKGPADIDKELLDLNTSKL